MILKIQRSDNKRHVTTPWAIFSDLLNIYYVVISGGEYRKMIERFDGNTIGEYPFDYSAIQGNPDRVMTVEATKKNGDSLYFAFNTTGYLLNDNGKTIETLNPQ